MKKTVSDIKRIRIIKPALIILALLIVAVSFFLPVPSGMGERGPTTIAIIMLAIILWITDIIPAAVTGMITIFLFSAFNILEFEQAAGNLGKEIIWLLIATLMMGQAIEKTSIHKRIAYNMFLLAKGNLKLIILFMMLFGLSLTFFIPSVLGRMVLILPICIGLLKSVEKQGVKGLGKIIIPAMTFVPFIGSFGVITGGGGTLYAAQLFETMGKSWSYIEWLIIMGPVVLVIVVLFWIVIITFLFRDNSIRVDQEYLLEERSKVGELSRQELKIMILYSLLLILWITKSLHGFSLAMSAVFVASLLFLPGIRLLDWKEAMNKIEWSILFAFAAGFSIADALNVSDITGWLSLTAEKYLGDTSSFIVALILMITLVLIRIGFLNYTMMIASFMPLVFTFAKVALINPIWLGMIALIGSSICFFFPMQTISGMTAFSLGHHTFQDHLKVGIILTVITVVVTLVSAFYYWPLVGLEILKLKI